MAPIDFYLFSGLKSALQERRFCDIIKNMKSGLKRLSQNGFQEYFQQLCIPWQKCIFA
jgi:hypothetical protein